MILILLCKYPTVGKVKTRLGKDIGMKKAALLQHAFLKKLIQTHTGNTQYRLLIGLKEPEKKDEFSEEFGVNREDIFIQQGEDLGAIMHHAICYGLTLSTSVALIGSDVPLIDSKTIIQSYSALRNDTIVLGPTGDGGYYLIATRKHIPEIITGIHYSTSTVLAETIDRCNQYGKKVILLPSAIDIDTVSALQEAIQNDETGWIKETYDAVCAV